MNSLTNANANANATNADFGISEVKVDPVLSPFPFDEPASLSSEERMRRIGVLRQRANSDLAVSDDELRYAIRLVQEERATRMTLGGKATKSSAGATPAIRPLAPDEL